MAVDSSHGISLCGGIGCRIVNNTVIDGEDCGPSSSCLARNNVAPSLVLGRGSSSDHNRAIGPDRYAESFVDPGALDFRPAPGSSLVDSGNPEFAPCADVLGVPRPRGSPVDIGAYER